MTLLHYLSAARFQGPDAGAFLQAQTSADIAALEPGGASYACYCSVRGQVYGLLLVCRQEDGYLVAAAAELLPAMLARLKMFVFRSKVEFSAQADTAVFGVAPGAAVSHGDVFCPGPQGLSYLFSEKPASVDNRHAVNFKALEIAQKVVWLGAGTSEKFIPQMLGFEQIGAVSFSKGCYPGQEIVARARYLGKVKRAPLVIRIEEPLPLPPGGRVELQRGDSWSKGTVIDSVADSAGALCFIIAPTEPAIGPDAVKIQDGVYRCATI